MKSNLWLCLIILFLTLTTLGGCSVVEGIFKAGMGTGIFIVVLIMAIIAFIAVKMMKSK